MKYYKIFSKYKDEMLLLILRANITFSNILYESKRKNGMRSIKQMRLLADDLEEMGNLLINLKEKIYETTKKWELEDAPIPKNMPTHKIRSSRLMLEEEDYAHLLERLEELSRE